jgi:hypothetical protein
MLPDRQTIRVNPPTGNGRRVVLFSPVGILIMGIGVLVLGVLLLPWALSGDQEGDRASRNSARVETPGPAPRQFPPREHGPEPAPTALIPPPQANPSPAASSADFEKAVFDSVPDESFALLSPEQQWGFAKAEEDFDAYYQETLRRGSAALDEWNAAVAEFHRDLVIRLGGETVDQLLKPPPVAGNP